MNFPAYCQYFKSIADQPLSAQQAPYDQPDYLNYVQLNWSRMNRWLKNGRLSEALVNRVKGIRSAQSWLVITEPWCGDAAHSVPFIELLSKVNPLISIRYELRDSEPFSINQYLTNGSKSIPKLVVRNSANTDLFAWGPRPVACQKIYTDLLTRNADQDEIKIALQKWYNEDKGQTLQEELLVQFTRID
ncbi:MAG TPA: thioredoxin family protein [Edaphocola sp.]|nr:thioredoxin family protein [Edaphocola sp.]